MSKKTKNKKWINSTIINGIEIKRDIRGSRFGYVRAQYPVRAITNGRILWKCKCDCGRIFLTRLNNLENGDTKSCGCQRIKLAILKTTKKKGEAGFNALYQKYKRNASNRGYSFGLSKEVFGQLTKQKCHYCGAKPNQRIKPGGVNGAYIYNGVDRKYNSKGYIISNIVSCCGQCNKAKMNTSYKEFLRWITKVHAHQKRKHTNAIA